MADGISFVRFFCQYKGDNAELEDLCDVENSSQEEPLIKALESASEASSLECEYSSVDGSVNPSTNSQFILQCGNDDDRPIMVPLLKEAVVEFSIQCDSDDEETMILGASIIVKINMESESAGLTCIDELIADGSTASFEIYCSKKSSILGP